MVRSLVREYLLSGQVALDKVADTVVQLYFKVDAFTELHNKINDHMMAVSFAEQPMEWMRESLQELDQAAAIGTDEDLEALIDQYAGLAGEQRP